MQTREFEEGLERMMKLAGQKRSAVMCAEAVPWRCHRSLIADALLARDVEVAEIASKSQIKPFSLHPWAQVNGTQVSYPGLPLEPSELGQ